MGFSLAFLGMTRVEEAIRVGRSRSGVLAAAKHDAAVEKAKKIDLSNPRTSLQSLGVGARGGLPRTKPELITLASALGLETTGTVGELTTRCRDAVAEFETQHDLNRARKLEKGAPKQKAYPGPLPSSAKVVTNFPEGIPMKAAPMTVPPSPQVRQQAMGLHDTMQQLSRMTLTLKDPIRKAKAQELLDAAGVDMTTNPMTLLRQYLQMLDQVPVDAADMPLPDPMAHPTTMRGPMLAEADFYSLDADDLMSMDFESCPSSVG